LLDVTRIAKGKLQLSFELFVSINTHRAYEICREDIAAKIFKWNFDSALLIRMSKVIPRVCNRCLELNQE